MRDFRDTVAHYLRASRVPFSTDSRAGAPNLPLGEAVRMFTPSDVAVEFHLNAAGSAAATGVETLSAPKHFDLGRRICAAVSDRLGIKNRGAKPEDSGQHKRLAFVRAGGVVVELFFLSNPDDLKAYEAVKWLLARDIAGILVAEAQNV